MQKVIQIIIKKILKVIFFNLKLLEIASEQLFFAMLKNINDFHGIIQILEKDYSFKPFFFKNLLNNNNLISNNNDNKIDNKYFNGKKRERELNNIFDDESDDESDDEKNDSNFFLKSENNISNNNKKNDNSYESSVSPPQDDNNDEKNELTFSFSNKNEVSKNIQNKNNNYKVIDNDNFNINENNYIQNIDLDNENNNVINNNLKYDDTIIKNEYQNNLILFIFESYILKWERNLMIYEKLSIDIYFFIEKIANFILLLKPNLNIFDHIYIGSYFSNTLRLNNLIIDSVLSFENEIKNEYYSIIIKNFNSELKNNEFKIDLKTNEKKEKYFEITYNILIYNLYLNTSYEIQNILFHRDYIINNQISIYKLICIKFLKSWRRDKKLYFLNPDIIEFIIISLNYNKIYELIPAFFNEIIYHLNENDYNQNYQMIEIKNLKESPSFNILKTECQNALNNIFNLQYFDFF